MRDRYVERVRLAMAAGDWWTLSELAMEAGCSETAVSARVRDLRKSEFGAHRIEKRRAGPGGLHQYRMIPARKRRLGRGLGELAKQSSGNRARGLSLFAVPTGGVDATPEQPMTGGVDATCRVDATGGVGATGTGGVDATCTGGVDATQMKQGDIETTTYSENDGNQEQPKAHSLPQKQPQPPPTPSATPAAGKKKSDKPKEPAPTPEQLEAAGRIDAAYRRLIRTIHNRGLGKKKSMIQIAQILLAGETEERLLNAVNLAAKDMASRDGRHRKGVGKFFNADDGIWENYLPEQYDDSDEPPPSDAELIDGAEKSFLDPEERADYWWRCKSRGGYVPAGVDCRPMPGTEEAV